jgi:hypothetical protein
VATVERGDLVRLESSDDGWYQVETEDGAVGWIRDDEAELLADDEDADDELGKPLLKRLRVRGGAHVGYTLVTQQVATAGVDGNPDGVPAQNYVLQGSSAAFGLFVDAALPVKPKIDVGLTLAYAGATSYPDLNNGAGMPSTGFKLHQVDGRGRVGYQLGVLGGLVASARLGVHYDVFAVDDVANFDSNPNRLPSDRLLGVTLGLGAEAAQLTPKLGARMRFDYMVGGSRKQTLNLEDGQSASTRALWFGVDVRYKVHAQFDLDVGYALQSAYTNFGAPAPNMRMNEGTGRERADLTHAIVVGASRAF